MNQGPGSTELADSWGVHAQGLWAWAAKLIPRNAGEAQNTAASLRNTTAGKGGTLPGQGSRRDLQNALATTGRFYLNTRPNRDRYCYVQNGLGCGAPNWPRRERRLPPGSCSRGGGGLEWTGQG